MCFLELVSPPNYAPSEVNLKPPGILECNMLCSYSVCIVCIGPCKTD